VLREVADADPSWTSFSYDPRREALGQPAFAAASDRVRKEIGAFLARENMLTLYAKRSLGGEDGDAGAGDALASGMGAASKTVTILYASDTGHGEECAKKVARQCRAGGFASSAVRCQAMDAFDVTALPAEPCILFCLSTAGKGEIPGNGRNFWENLSKRVGDLADKLGDVKYSVFGLGDSHYWGKGTPDSAANFAKPARDLDALLEQLGASRLAPLCFGDDQDVDQYMTGFGEWTARLYEVLGVNATSSAAEGDDGPVKSDEVIKIESKQLRGTLKESLDDVTTGQVPFHDTKLIKCHGSYQQDDRDARQERAKLGIENAFSFMIRIRLPGGYCTAEQWLAMDDICGTYANGTLKVTTRQTWQVHGVLKRDVKATMQAMNRACMDTIAACGDVCRNVLCCSDPRVCSREMHDRILRYTYDIHDHCLPRTGAYHEIYLMEGEEMAEKHQVLGSTPIEEEPLYGTVYLPRKYKVAVAIPPSNDVDVYAHDCGFIAIINDGVLEGFNVSVGGGLGFSWSNTKTHPRLADVIGFCEPDDAKYVCEAIMLVTRDFSDRTNRKHARVKYCMEDYGVDFYREEVERHLGKPLQPARHHRFEYRGDMLGWLQTEDGLWHCGTYTPIGRVKDQCRIAFKKIAEELVEVGAFRLTCNQQVMISEVPPEKKDRIQSILDQYHVPHSTRDVGGMMRNMMSCVALPTCPLAFAEAERYLPTLTERIESVMERCGLRDDEISIRMTGCPNSCGRPSLGEIGFIGKAPDTYNMYLGACFAGERLNTLYRESVNEDQILEELTPMLEKYAGSRSHKGERFGDFVIRMGYVKPMINGRDWYKNAN